jgi:N,N'-diacetyllegionaminate synthase
MNTNMIEFGQHALTRCGPAPVIAEIGVNHDGRLERALELVSIAADCGADAVKLQIFRAERLMHESCGFAQYQQNGVMDVNAAAMLRRYELSDAALNELVCEIRRLEMIPLATPFSPQDVERIEQLNLPAIKIASPDLVNWPLLRRAARANRPLLISTGAASINEISSAVAWLRGWKASFVLLHCVSAYPTRPADANLCWITEMAERFGVAVGFSDHTTEVISGALAVAAGAVVVEKHLTYDCAADGPDHASSCEPDDFAQYIRLIRLAQQMRGTEGKRVLECERDVRTVSRQSLVAARDIPAGHIMMENDLIVQRPGTGIPASALPSIVGRRSGQFIRAGEMLTWRILSDAA